VSAAVRRALAADLDLTTLYRILRLRQDVFVIEQDCPYLDIDGRDLEPATVHLWIDEDPASETVTSCARVLAEPDGTTVIGRIVTAAAARGQGHATRLMEAALGLGPGPFDLKAQSRLAGWYAGFGFAPCGPEFVEDGIPHTPMRRPAGG
jgi:ElaA protein